MEIIPPKNQPTPSPAYRTAPEHLPAPPPAKDNSPNLGGPLRNAASTIGLFLSAFLIAILLNTFVIQSYQVDGVSMEPTLQNTDRLIVNKIPRTVSRVDGHQYVPARGDIIIFNQDGLPGFIGTKQLIKRVVGLPGDHVVVSGGKITIYNSQHPEGFDPDITGSYRISQTTAIPYDGTLNSHQLFVCGDNRGNSEDSRSFGPINTSQVVAKLVLRILPLSKTQSF
jgi:signal peptidase I